LLAGVLARFALGGFADAATAPWLIVICTATYVIARQFAPRYAVIAVLVTGIGTSVLSGTFAGSRLEFSVARPIFTAPSFSFAAIVAISLPIFIVTMAGQNLPGVAAIRHAKYEAPISPIVGSTGLATLALAPFGGYMYSMSAITAAICMEPAAHEDPRRRYTAALTFGGFYIAAGLFGTTVTSALVAFPGELIRIVTTLALLPTIGANLAVATRDESHREAAAITFLVTLSGVTVAKVGSPFWGAAAGVITTLISGGNLAARFRR
jgi:benzoate membrane transport protein